MRSHELGIQGERLTAGFLQSKGYVILEQNWRHRKAEIDILALKDDLLVAVEVKTRSSDFFGDPQEFVTKSKIKLLTTAVNAYVNMRQLEVEVRFDVIGILKSGLSNDAIRIDHLEDAYFIF